MSTEKNKSVLVPFLIIAGMFFIFGFVTWINGALIPFMKTMCELSDAESFLVVSASYISFVVMAVPASMVLKKIGYRRGMSLGLILMGLGALVFIPAASSRTYAIFLTGIFIQGAGMTILQTASNPYITILGPIESAAKRISIMGICNKIAGALGSIIFGVLLLSGIKEINEKLGLVKGTERDLILDQMADSVVGPYIIMAIALGVLGVLINFAPLPDLNMGEEEEEGNVTSSESDFASSKTSVFQFPHLLLGVLALFMYVGVEVAAGDTIIAYGISMDLEGATRFTSFTLGFMVITYLAGAILIPKVISQKAALTGSAILGSIFTVCIVMTEGFTSVIFVAMLGIANALVWPAIWPLAIDKLGKYTKTGAALLIMAIAGGAVISPIYGLFVGSQKDSMVTERAGEIDAAVKNANQILISYPKTQIVDSNEVALDPTLLAKINAASLNLDTASMKLAENSISNEDVIKYIKLSNADIHGAFDLSVGLNAAKDSLSKLVKAIGKDADLAPSFATAFINTFTGGVDVTGEFNAWGDKLNKVINSADKSTVGAGIGDLVSLAGDLKTKVAGKAELESRLDDIVSLLGTAKNNLSSLSENDQILAKSAAELGKADAQIKPVVAQASTSGYWVLLPCYLIILFFAVKGHKIGLPEKA